jgi:hypothetical protein
VSGGGRCPLACRRVLWRWTGSHSSLWFYACSPSCSRASVWSLSFLDGVFSFIVSGVVKLLSSSPSCLLNSRLHKKKKSLVVITLGAFTIRKDLHICTFIESTFYIFSYLIVANLHICPYTEAVGFCICAYAEAINFCICEYMEVGHFCIWAYAKVAHIEGDFHKCTHMKYLM